MTSREASTRTVIAVVLNWNGLADTLECLESARQAPYPELKIVVVDNGSARPEADAISDSGLTDWVLRNDTNLGFAGGANVGMRHAMAEGADYIWLLNNDAIVGRDCLARLVEAGEKDAGVGLLSPVIYADEHHRSIQSAGTVVNLARETQTKLRSLTDTRRNEAGGRLALLGTALLIKRSVVERIGVLDTRFFAYQEDTDYSVRAMRAGIGTVLVPEAAIFHKYGRSLGGKQAPVREFLFTRNYYLFWRTHLAGWQRRTYPSRYAAWVLDRVHTARRAGNHEIAEHMLSGAWNALRGRWGPWEARRPVPHSVERILTRWVLGWHPYFWMRLLRGDIRGVSREMLRRILMRSS